LPHGNRKGNGEACVTYQAHGDSADWILSTFGIISANPELGTTDQFSNFFFIFTRDVLLEIMTQNVPWAFRTFRKFGAMMGFNHIHTTSNGTAVKLEYDVLNKGFSDFSRSESPKKGEFSF